jgi:hypothetical protein
MKRGRFVANGGNFSETLENASSSLASGAPALSAQVRNPVLMDVHKKKEFLQICEWW